MPKRLQHTPFINLLPSSIAGDATVQAASATLDTLLHKTVLAVPNLLLFARLCITAGRTVQPTMLPALQRLIHARGGLKPLNIAELELLAWQFHVDFRQVATTDVQLAEMVLQAIPWHRIKGTPRSIINALALFGYGTPTAQEVPSRAAGVQRLPRQSQATASAVQEVRSSGITIEEDGVGQYWATYQLGLPQIADVPTVKKILSIAREMQPVRCRLWRVYTDVWDMRPAIYSGKMGYSEAYYSFYSGVPVPDDPTGGTGNDDVLVSFGHKRGAQCPVQAKFPHMGIERVRGTLCFRLDALVYGYSCYSDKPIRNHGFARYRLRQVHFDHAKTLWHFTRRSISRVQAVYGQSPYGDTNSRYGRPMASTFDNPPIYGQSLYGLHDCERHAHILDEITLRPRHASTAPYPWSDPPHIAHDRQGVHAAQAAQVFPTNATWQGQWDSRRWRAFGPQTLLTRSTDI